MKITSLKKGLSFRIITIIFANVIIITAIIFGYIYKVSHDTISENLKENSKLLTYSTVHEVEKILTAVQKMPNNISKIIETGNYSASELHRILQLEVSSNEEIFGAALSYEPDYKGAEKEHSVVYIYKDKAGLKTSLIAKNDTNFTSLEWYSEPKKLQKPIWSEPYFDKGLGNIVMSTYSVPLYKTIKGKNKFIGVLTADLSLDWLQKIVSSIKVYETGYAFMISRNGSLVTHPKKEVIMNKTIFGIAADTKSEELSIIGKNMINGKSSFAEVEYHNLTTGKLSWISYAPIKINGWSLGIVYPVDELTAPLSNLFKVVIVLAIIGAVILFFVIVLISRSITRPIQKLVFAAQKISEGSFDIELPKFKSQDEISELTNSFSVMQTALQQSIEKLKNANDELELYSKTLEEKVEYRTAELKEKNSQLDKAVENVRTLNQIGRQITSTLKLESIFATVHDRVNQLLDASTFSIMVYNENEQLLDCKLAIENGERLPEFSFSTLDKNRFAVWCIDNQKPIFINDVDTEFSNYIATRAKPKAGKYVSSLIYLPLVVNQKTVGVISAQSYNKNAYSESDLDILSNIANYTAIALENAFAYENINRANRDLKEAQTQLVQSEKMASLGQLTAGIAHEIKNPLNFINNFSELSIELSKELLEEIETQLGKLEPKSVAYIREILKDIEHNVTKINEHGKRADSIVKGMLLHSRGKSGEKQKTNLNDLLTEYLNLAYHGFRAQDSSFNVKMETTLDNSIELVNVVPQNMSRVFLNIFNNACYSVNEKKKEFKDSFNPVLLVTSKNLGDKIEVIIKDNGKGISKEILDKVFNPFFTTKPTGKGTGLGLSLSYDIIVQEHKGELKVNSEVGEYAEFIITIPKNL
ncbi:MAG: cache domain-containing protein [Melioribacteraceae bacterium]